MEQSNITEEVRLLRVVAAEAVEEPDVIARHPDVIDALNVIASYDRLNDHFGGNGHDPNGFAAALAEGLAPYREAPLDDDPEIVQQLVFLAWALETERSPEELAEMQILA
ncbi:MAG: hypothetical protein QM729_09965 [Solirubrobacterales bacterium]